MLPPDIVRRLRNLPVSQIVRALERNGFTYSRTRGAGRLYRHPDGRRVVIHFHHSGDTLPLGTLRNVLRGARWTEEDVVRLGLM